MIAMAKETWDFLVHVFSTIPDWMVVMLLSWAATVGTTQFARVFVPVSWSKLKSHAVMQLVSMSAALAVTQALIGGKWGAAMGVVIGFWAIGAYYLVELIACHVWPWLCVKITWNKVK